MIHLYGRHTSYNVQKVLWALDELHLDFQHTNLGGAYGGLDTTEFKALNPNRRVPVLDDNGLIVWESNAIVRYLAATYGQGTLWAQDPGERSHADRWMEWAVNSLLPPFIGLFWGYYRTPEVDRNLGRIGHLRSQCEQQFALLDEHLRDRPYLAGEAFSMGDIPAGTCLYRYFEMGLEVEKPANVCAWYQSLLDREPYHQRVAEPFDELFGRLDY